MKTGVVLELKNGNAVVLDGSGAFRTVVAESDWRAGDVVYLPSARKSARWALPLCACLALILAGAGGWLWMAPAALVSLDVNPSVEMTLNRFDRVVSARGMNDEGVELLAAGPVRGLAADEALASLLGNGYLKPFLERENYVALTVQSERPELEAHLLALVDQTTASAVSPETRVACHGVDASLVEAAHGCGVTAGKYLALLELQAADPNIDITEYAHCGLGEIEAQTARCHAANAEYWDGGTSADEYWDSGTSTDDFWPGCGYGHGHRHGW